MVATLIATLFLAKVGRKTLLWIFSFLMAAALFALGFLYSYADSSNSFLNYLQLILCLLFIIFFEFSIGPILWIYMSETMTERGVNFGTYINWIVNFVITVITPRAINSIKGWLFNIFGIFCIVGAVFILIIVKETRGLSDK